MSMLWHGHKVCPTEESCAGGAALAFLVVIGLIFGGPTFAADTPTDRDEELLKESGVAVTAEALTQLLRDRSPEDVDLKQLELRIGQLNSADSATREQASRELMKWGHLVLGPLQKAAGDKDANIATRAARVLETVARENYLAQPSAAARVLAKRWPDQAVSPLLHFLPFADARTEEEIAFALDGLVAGQGTISEALLGALKDTAGPRRALAACIVGRRGTDGQRAGVRKLLTDAEAVVRLRAAQGLLAAKDKFAIPDLIGLLDEADVAVSWQAEELLHWAAGDTAPTASVGAATADLRQRCRTAWEEWHRVWGEKVDLEKCYAGVKRPGLFLICSTVDKDKPGMGRVWLRGCDGQPRWQHPGDFVDAQWLTDNRLLLGESKFDANEGSPTTGEVTERDLAGKVLWKVNDVGFRCTCRRLANGNTFISNIQAPTVEVNAAGQREVNYKDLLWPLEREHRFFIKGLKWKLDDGRIAWTDGEYRTLGESDAATGKLVRKVQVDPQAEGTFRPVTILPDGHWLLSYTPAPPAGVKRGQEPRNRLVEVDGAGKIVWQSSVPFALSALRLRNGHTIINSGGFFTIGHPGLVEVDRDGKKLWEDFNVGFVHQVRQCLPLVELGFDQPPRDVEDLDSVAYRVKGLKDKDRNVRLRSVLFLAEFGPKAEPAVPALVEALGDPDERVSREAEEVLRLVGRPALSALLETWDDMRPGARAHAIGVFSSPKVRGELRGEEAKEVATKVVAAARDEAAVVRRMAINVMPGFIDLSEEAMPALIRALKDKDTGTAVYSAANLGYVKQPTQEIMTALIEAVTSTEDGLRRSSFLSLGQLAARDRSYAPAVVEVLRTALRGQDSVKELSNFGLRSAAAAGLRMLKEDAKSAVPDLIEALRAEGAPDDRIASAIRTGATEALGAIGPEAKSAVPHLLAILQNKDSSREAGEERKRAVEALKQIDPGVKLPELPNR